MTDAIILLFVLSAAPCPATPPAGLVDVHDIAPSIRLFVGYHGRDNFTGARVPGYEIPRAWLRDDAALALRRAERALERDGFGLVVFDAYRPRHAVLAMVAWAEANDPSLLDDGFVARDSDHSRGIAVDVGLVDRDGKFLDMGTRWDTFDPRAHYRGVEGSTFERRKRLRVAMQRAGFLPYEREWWHFTFASEGRAHDRPYRCDGS